MKSSAQARPVATSITASTSARLGSHPSSTLLAIALLTVRRFSALRPTNNSGQRPAAPLTRLPLLTLSFYRGVLTRRIKKTVPVGLVSGQRPYPGGRAESHLKSRL